MLHELGLLQVSLVAMSAAQWIRPWRRLHQECLKLLLLAFLPVCSCSKKGNLSGFLCHQLFAGYLHPPQQSVQRIPWRNGLKCLAAALVHLRSALTEGSSQRPASMALSAALAMAIPPVDAQLARAAVRRWFLAARAAPSEADRAEYTTEIFKGWYTPPEGPHDRAYRPQGDLQREELYQHIIEMYYQRRPLVLLARQPSFYPFFLDLDLFGSRSDDHLRTAVQGQDGDHLVLFKCIATALLEIFPSHQVLEVAAFESSGLDRAKKCFKASFHLVFPDIIVKRPELCHGPLETCLLNRAASHILVRDYVVYRLTEMEHGQNEAARRLTRLKDKVSNECLEENDGDARRNDWCEILDENPFWHDPRPGKRTGLRLPFTDKRYKEEELEGRVKFPLGRWSFQAGEAALQPLPNLSPVEWVRLGDISRSRLAETPIEKLIDDKVDPFCMCLVCRGIR